MLAAADGDSMFREPTIPGISTTCAAIEFEYEGDTDLSEVYIFTKRPEDLDFVEWGEPQPVRLVRRAEVRRAWGTGQPAAYRTLMRDLPPGQQFQVKIADDNDGGHELSPASAIVTSLKRPVRPASPEDLRLHRTDPRKNLQRHDGSVCVDLHWSHPHPKLNDDPADVYFRIKYNYTGEDPVEYCSDIIGSTSSRECGEPLESFTTLPSNFATICGLRPKRNIRFIVEAFNCDLETVAQHVEATTPPSAPSVITYTVTHPGNQESVAGFRPLAVIDWIPQHDSLIEGHVVYLGLTQISSMKLMCYVPHNHSSYASGHLEIPIEKKNHTYAEGSLLLRDYLARFHVHQEQELLIATRTAYFVNGEKVGHLESPAYSHRLGEWIVMDEAVKCLTSFQARHPSYVSHPVVLSWTQEQSLSMYD